MATLEEIADDVKVALNRPDIYKANPAAGEVDIKYIYNAVNTVITDITVEEDFRVCEASFDPDAFTDTIRLPSDFKKFISLWYTKNGVEIYPPIERRPFSQALALRNEEANSPESYSGAYICAIFGLDLRVFPPPPESDPGGARLYYYRFLTNLQAEESNYFTERFPGYLAEAAAVHILKASIQPRGDNTAIYDFERLVNNLKKNILSDEVQAKGTAT